MDCWHFFDIRQMAKCVITLFRDQKSLIRFHLKIEFFLIFFCFLKPSHATSPELVTHVSGSQASGR